MNNHKQSKSEQKPVYFNIENFVNMVLVATEMNKAEPAVLEELSLQISQTLSDRVTSTVIASLSEKELFLLEKIVEDHPELDRIDALSIITPSIPGLQEKILKEVSDLYDELVDNAKLINQKLNQ